MIEQIVIAGLCNRMREISSGIALSKAANQKLTVYWYKNKNLNCPYRLLFRPIKGVRIVDVETKRRKALFRPWSLIYRIRRRLFDYDLFLGNEQIHEYRAQGIDLASVVAGVKRCGIITYLRFYGSPPYHEHFRPRDKILREVEKTISDREPGELVGVHIRRGDNVASIQVSPVELFVERMRLEVEREPEVVFFLATDDPDTEQKIVEHFPGRVLTRPKVFARNRAGGVRDALIDLLVLSSCRLILGSYWSSFSETASELGGAEIETVRTPRGS